MAGIADRLAEEFAVTPRQGGIADRLAAAEVPLPGPEHFDMPATATGPAPTFNPFTGPPGVGAPSVIREPGAGMMPPGLGRMAVQGGATAVGGLVAGVPGAVAGSVVGGQGYDALTGGSPSVGSATVDAVTGLAGPVVARLGPVLGQWFTGLRPGVHQRVLDIFGGRVAATADDVAQLRSSLGDLALSLEQQAGNTVARDQASVLRRMLAAPDNWFIRSLTQLGHSAQPGPTALDAASRIAQASAGTLQAAAARSGLGGAIGGTAGWVFDNPGVGALVGAGISEGILSRAIPSLIANPAARNWILRLGPSPSSTEIGTGLVALMADNSLTPDQRQAAGQILLNWMNIPSAHAGTPDQTAGSRAPTRRSGNPFADIETVMTPAGPRGRNPRTGQFAPLGDE